MSKVLVVDETEDILELMRGILEKSGAGFTVLTADNPDDALRIAEVQHPDLILMDIIIPDNGFETCRQLKEKPETAQIPLLMFTVLDDEKHRSKAEELGADGYITKPFEAGELVETVKKHLK